MIYNGYWDGAKVAWARGIGGGECQTETHNINNRNKENATHREKSTIYYIGINIYLKETRNTTNCEGEEQMERPHKSQQIL